MITLPSAAQRSITGTVLLRLGEKVAAGRMRCSSRVAFLVAILLSSLILQPSSLFAQSNLTATLTFTNAIGITNGDSITVSGTTWTVTNSSASLRYILPTNTAAAGATNFYNKLISLTNNSAYTVTWLDKTNVALRFRTFNLQPSTFNLSKSGTWGILTLVTNPNAGASIGASNLVVNRLTFADNTSMTTAASGSGGGTIVTSNDNTILVTATEVTSGVTNFSLAANTAVLATDSDLLDGTNKVRIAYQAADAVNLVTANTFTSNSLGQISFRTNGFLTEIYYTNKLVGRITSLDWYFDNDVVAGLVFVREIDSLDGFKMLSYETNWTTLRNGDSMIKIRPNSSAPTTTNAFELWPRLDEDEFGVPIYVGHFFIGTNAIVYSDAGFNGPGDGLTGILTNNISNLGGFVGGAARIATGLTNANGGGLTNLNASALASGTVPVSRLMSTNNIIDQTSPRLGVYLGTNALATNLIPASLLTGQGATNLTLVNPVISGQFTNNATGTTNAGFVNTAGPTTNFLAAIFRNNIGAQGSAVLNVHSAQVDVWGAQNNPTTGWDQRKLTLDGPNKTLGVSGDSKIGFFSGTSTTGSPDAIIDRLAATVVRITNSVLVPGIMFAGSGFNSSISNGLAPFSITSPWTNTFPRNMVAYIGGTTVTTTLNGTTLFSALTGGQSVIVQTNEVVTFSGTGVSATAKPF